MANLAFHHVAREYARYRPEYPTAVLDHLNALTGPANDRWALDLGCGTGQLSRPLASAGWRVLAADADESLLRQMRRDRGGRLSAVRCIAEAIGVTGDAVALVTCAQTMHWFNPRYSLLEIGRVLRFPGGIAVFLWTDRRLESPFVAQFEAFIRQWSPTYTREYAEQDWCAKLVSTNRFRRESDTRVNWNWRPTVDEFVGFAGTLTYLRNTVARKDWPRLASDLRRMAGDRFPVEICEIPMTTRLIAFERTNLSVNST